MAVPLTNDVHDQASGPAHRRPRDIPPSVGAPVRRASPPAQRVRLPVVRPRGPRDHLGHTPPRGRRRTPAAAAEAVRSGTITVTPDGAADDDTPSANGPAQPGADTYAARFLSAATRLDITGIDESLDAGFGLGSFEHVVDSGCSPPSGRSARAGHVERSTSRESTPQATPCIGGSPRRSMPPAAGLGAPP